MIKIAICDDEERELERTQKLLAEYTQEKLSVKAFRSGETLLAAGERFDVILLDIDMEGLNGIETARRIRLVDKEVKLIYLTNYCDYITFAFAVHAFAYLLKPVQKEELFSQLEEAAAYGLPRLSGELEFQALEGIVRINSSHILYFEYMDRKVLMHTDTKLWHLKRRITQIAQDMEEYGFAMPHKSFVVNLYAVQCIHGYDIILTDGSLLPLSQKKSLQFRRRLNQFLAGEGR